jgi:catalase
VQAAMFFRSLSPVEQDHLVNAYRFELSKVDVPEVVDRMLVRLAQIDTTLCARVAEGLGLPPPDQQQPVADVSPSPALAMLTGEMYPVDGRVVQILANDGCDLGGIRVLQDALLAAGVTAHVVAPHKGAIAGAGRRRNDELTVDRSFLTARAAEADAVVVAGGSALSEVPAVVAFVQEAFRHYKTIGAWGDGVLLLEAAGIEAQEPGVEISERATKSLARALIQAMGVHRHWDRATNGGLA